MNKYPLFVVDFWAPWCGPCRMVSPLIQQTATELAGEVVFGKLNVDENPMTSSAFGIQSIPSIAIFKNGRHVDGFVGVTSKSQMQTRSYHTLTVAALTGRKIEVVVGSMASCSKRYTLYHVRTGNI